MPRSCQVLVSAIAASIPCALADQWPEVSMSDDEMSLNVSLTSFNQSCNYHLIATSVFAQPAKILRYTDQGLEQLLPSMSRAYASRKHNMWATAIVEDSRSSQMRVSGLFVCQNVLIDIPTFTDKIGIDDTKLRPSLDPLDDVHTSTSWLPGGMRGARRLTGATLSRYEIDEGDNAFEVVNETDTWQVPEGIQEYRGIGYETDEGDNAYEIVNESTTWQVPEEIEEYRGAGYVWKGEKWYPGCFTGDHIRHVFKIGIVADVAAVQKHGSKLMSLIESTVAKASFVFESQLHTRLEITELKIYESANTAPEYARGECTKWYKSKSNHDAHIEQLLKAFHASSEARQASIGGAAHLFTGCGKHIFFGGTVGIAYVSGVCDSHKQGVTRLLNSMSWTTFAHELGHNFGADHSFEEGQERTGGIMDYGNGRLNGEYQFNTKYRKSEMCMKMDQSVNNCGDNFVLDPNPELDTPDLISDACTKSWLLAAASWILHFCLCFIWTLSEN